MAAVATALTSVGGLAAAVGLPALSTPASAATTLPADHVTVTVGGSAPYKLDGDVTSGGVAVHDNVVTYSTSEIKGQAGVPGPNGGPASVDFEITSGLLGLSGPVTLTDPAAGIKIALTVNGGVTRTADAVVTWSGSGQVTRGTTTSTQPVTFTVADRHPDEGNYAIHLTHDGQARQAIVHIPAGYTGAPLAALVHFPGLYETPALAEFFGRMSDFADAHGFIQVTPEHYGSGWQGVTGGDPFPQVDDPGFVRALMATVVARFNADPSRLYASGMSNGAFFTNLLGCQENDLFAAFAAVSGPLQDTADCHPGRPVPILEIHGTADPLVPFSGAKPSADFWATNNGCQLTTTDTTLPDVDPNDNTRVIRHVYNGCPADAPVVFYEITGGGHNWPGGIAYLGPLLGGETYDIDADAVIWDFVSHFSH